MGNYTEIIEQSGSKAWGLGSRPMFYDHVIGWMSYGNSKWTERQGSHKYKTDFNRNHTKAILRFSTKVPISRTNDFGRLLTCVTANKNLRLLATSGLLRNNQLSRVATTIQTEFHNLQTIYWNTHENVIKNAVLIIFITTNTLTIRSQFLPFWFLKQSYIFFQVSLPQSRTDPLNQTHSEIKFMYTAGIK